MNKTKGVQFIALTALLAVNAVMPLQANNSWSQRIIGNLFSSESAKIAAGVTCATIAQFTAQKIMTIKMYNSHLKYGMNVDKNKSFLMIRYNNEGVLCSAGIGLLATVAARLGTSPLNSSDVVRPVGIGMGIVAASYVLGGIYGYCYSPMLKDCNAFQHESTRRYGAAVNSYNLALKIAPLVVAGVGGYMIYDRCTRS